MRGLVVTTTWRTPDLAHPTGAASITRRQAQVLCGFTHGHSNGEIAARLHLTEDTVKSHAAALFRALGARDRAHAAALAASGQVTVIVRGVA